MPDWGRLLREILNRHLDRWEVVSKIESDAVERNVGGLRIQTAGRSEHARPVLVRTSTTEMGASGVARVVGDGDRVGSPTKDPLVVERGGPRVEVDVIFEEEDGVDGELGGGVRLCLSACRNGDGFERTRSRRRCLLAVPEEHHPLLTIGLSERGRGGVVGDDRGGVLDRQKLGGDECGGDSRYWVAAVEGMLSAAAGSQELLFGLAAQVEDRIEARHYQSSAGRQRDRMYRHECVQAARISLVSEQHVVVEALTVAVNARVPVILWGAPGTGKTSAVRALADAADWPCETVIASIREPSDFAGLPVISRTGPDTTVEFAPPRWAQRLADAGYGLLFLDEMTTAPPAVQAALLRVVLERTVGDLTLPHDVAVVAAANPPAQAADGWDLSPPLANRFCHLDWTVDAQTLARGLASGWQTNSTLSRSPIEPERLATQRSWVSGFITVRPPLTLDVPEDAAAGGQAWPSPRTWDMVAQLLTSADAAAASQAARSLLVRGAVGDGPGLEYMTWLEEADLPDPEALLADPASFSLPDRGDRAYAALTSVAAVVAARPTPDRWTRGWAVLDHARRSAPDIAATAARTLAKCRPDGTPIPDAVHGFAPILRDAGLLS